MENMQILVSESATSYIAELRRQENKPNLRLRVSVLGGGCSGFKYGIELDDSVNADDHLFGPEGNPVMVTDDVSLGYLAGSEIDFIDDFSGSSFKVINPKAKSGCGCGKSFTMDMSE